MIICTGCGGNNQDDARFCFQCGRKLQSDFTAGPDSGGSFFLQEHIPERFREMLDEGVGKYVEAWLYILVLVVTAIACMWENDYRALYVAAPLAGLIAWLRKI